MRNKSITAIFLAFGAAVFYAINIPFSKLLLSHVPSTMMASFLYLGAGLGVGIMYIFHWKKEPKTERLGKIDLKYTILMVILDIFAPILLMVGLKYGAASSASLLGNFEIVATTVIALVIFREKVGKNMWPAILLITLSGVILSFEGWGSFKFSAGSLFVILATLCWGFENNCTRSISEKSTYEIVTIKGIFSGLGSLMVALAIGEKFPHIIYILLTFLLGFVSYGLSIFMYVRAQRNLGAAKTSAYYAVAPFVGTGLSFLLVKEKISANYIVALIIMIAGCFFVVKETLKH